MVFWNNPCKSWGTWIKFQGNFVRNFKDISKKKKKIAGIVRWLGNVKFKIKFIGNLEKQKLIFSENSKGNFDELLELLLGNFIKFKVKFFGN